MGFDAALDAALGSPGKGGLPSAPPLPESLLETSSLLPWQAALAACLQLLQRCLEAVARGSSSGGGQDGAAASTASPPLEPLQQLASKVVGEKQRGAAAAAVLKVVHSAHGRHGWQLAVRGANQAPIGGAMLHFLALLQELVSVRMVQRVAPVLLTALASLLHCLLPAARREQEMVLSGAPNKRHLLPLQLVAPAVQAPLLYARHNVSLPDLTGSVSPASLSGQAACCLLNLAVAQGPPAPPAPAGPSSQPRLAAAYLGQPPGSFAASVLWALVAGDRSIRAGDQPGWANDLGLDPSHLVLLQASAAARASAASELLVLLGQCLQGLQERLAADRTPATLDDLLPAMDACSAALACVLRQEGDQQQLQEQGVDLGGVHGAGPVGRQSAAPVLGARAAVKRLAAVATQLCGLCSAAAQHLARLLDSPPSEGAQDIADVVSSCSGLAAVLAVGMELAEAVGQLLQVPALPRQHAQQLEGAVEELEGAQQACLELLRSLPDGHPIYSAATAAMEAAPSLWHPGAVEEGGVLGGEEGGSGSQGDVGQRQLRPGQQKSSHKNGGGKGRRCLEDVRNPYLRAILAENSNELGGRFFCLCCLCGPCVAPAVPSGCRLSTQCMWNLGQGQRLLADPISDTLTQTLTHCRSPQ